MKKMLMRKLTVFNFAIKLEFIKQFFSILMLPNLSSIKSCQSLILSTVSVPHMF